MRAEDLRLETMLNLDPDAGRILVGDQRFILVSANALGVLRKDLISALGMERAKGFLIRYGWACGYQDAVEIRDRFPWQDDLEWWRAGPALHGLEGVVRVKLTDLQRDRAQGVFYMAGVWENSFEAEQHLRHFGPQDFPVCWSLVGYASGYGSGYFGQQVVFKEVRCVGRGDPHCAFVGQTLDGWGAGIATELSYYREDKIVEELDRAYRRIQTQHDLLQRTAEIHGELTRLALGGRGLPALAGELARLTDRGVLVEDKDLQVLACHPADLGPQGLARAQAEPAVQERLLAMQHDRRRALIPPLPALGLREARLTAPIGVGGRILGYVSILHGGRDFGDLEGMVVERAAAVCAIELLRREAVRETEERIRGDFLADLVVGRLGDPQVLERRAAYVGLDLAGQYQVVVVDVDDFAGVARALKSNEPRITALKQALHRVVLAAARAHDPRALASGRSDAIVLLLQVAGETRVGPEFAAHLRRAVAEACPELSVSIGIGNTARGAAAFARSYSEAQQALELARRFGGRAVTAAYADLGVYGLLLRSQHQEELQAFARQLLGTLLEYDRRRRADLVVTLDALLRHNGELERAARTLNLRVSGLKYRLKRIEEISGLSLRDPQVRLNLQVALMIWHLSESSRNVGPG